MIQFELLASGQFEQVVTDPPLEIDSQLRAVLSHPPRRLNRYAKLALIGAHRCVAGYDGGLPTDCPLIIASEQGPLAEAVNLMKDILLDHQPLKPVGFINLSGNIAGFHIAASLGLSGRNITVSRAGNSFAALLELAALSGPGPALLGMLSESSWPLDEQQLRMAPHAGHSLVEASNWMLVRRLTEGDSVASGRAVLESRRTSNAEEARAWLGASGYWLLDPRCASSLRDEWTADLDEQGEVTAPLLHAGHPDALVHGLLHGLDLMCSGAVLHAVSQDGASWQLLALKVAGR